MILSSDYVDFFEIERILSFLCQDIPVKKETSPFSRSYVYVLDGNVVGFIQYQIIYERAELDYLIVHPDFRGQKIASKLIEFMFFDVQSKVLNITLEVRKSNQIAIHLYEKHGFKVCAVRKRYYQMEDGLLMMKEMML